MRPTRTVLSLALIGWGLLVCVGGSARADSPAAESIAIQLKWHHSFQFAGYYAAVEKGFYAAEGLDVRLIAREPDRGAVDVVLAGDAQYGVADAGLILARDAGAPVVLVAQIFQHSPLVFLTHADSGIIGPQELAGHTVMLDTDGASHAPLYAMLLTALDDVDAVTIVPHTFGLEEFVRRDVDAISAYLTSQPFELRRRGVPFHVINPQSYGIDFYGDNLFTTEHELRLHPERVVQVRRATLEGWRYALAQPDEIIDLIRAKYAPAVAREQLVFEAAETRKMIVPDTVELGRVDEGRFRRVAEVYARLEITESAGLPSGFLYGPSLGPTVDLTPEERAWMAAHPVVRLGVMTDLEPLAVVREGEPLAGIVADVMDLVSRRTGLGIRLRPGPWTELVGRMERRELDGLATASPESAEPLGLLATRVYVRQQIAVFARSDRRLRVDELQDLRGLRVAILARSAVADQVLRPIAGEIERVDVQRTGDGLELVAEGKADVTITTLFDEYYRTAHGLTNVVPIHILREPLLETAALVRRDWPELASILDKGLATLSDGELGFIVRKWTGRPPAPRTELTPEERAWLTAHPVIRVAADANWAPLEWRDDDGTYRGFCVDHLRRLERGLGVRFEFVQGATWPELLDMAKAREVDGFACLSRTPSRADFLTFTRPFVSIPAALFASADVTYVPSFADLEGRQVAVRAGWSLEERLRSDWPGIEVVPVPSVRDGIAKVRRGEAFAYLGGLLPTSHYLSRTGDSGVHVVGESPYTLDQAMAVRSDWPLLASILQKGLDALPESERDAMLLKWTPVRYEHGADYSLVWKVGVPLLAFLVLFAYWTRRLSVEVRQRKEIERKLVAHQDHLEERVAERTAELATALGELRASVAERERAESENARLAMAVDQAAEGVVITSPTDEILFVNPAFERITGRAREEVVGRTGHVFAEEPSNAGVLRKMRAAVAQDGHWGGRTFVRCDGGALREVEATISVVRDGGGAVAGNITILRDMTQERRLEAQLAQAQKMEAIGTLAGGIAHDFNNILGAILGYGELAREDAGENSALREDLDHVLAAGMRAQELVKQILTFARQAKPELRPVQVSLIVKEAIKLLRASLPTTIEIRQDVASLTTVLADPTNLHQIVMNLCTNAARAMPDGGVLEVRLVDERLDEDASVRHVGVAPGAFLRLTVADTGVGMSEDVLGRIFEPFFTTRAQGEGTGLGLSVVHGIVRDLGGTITVESEPGAGSTFHVLLPAADRAQAAFAEATAAASRGNERILFVDDEEALVALAENILGRLGYRVTGTTSSVDALARLRANPDGFDLLITDMTMPTMAGDQLVEAALAVRPELPIILCTGYSERMTEQRARAIGVQAFLQKPLVPSQLAETIRAALA